MEDRDKNKHARDRSVRECSDSLFVPGGLRGDIVGHEPVGIIEGSKDLFALFLPALDMLHPMTEKYPFEYNYVGPVIERMATIVRL